MGNEIVYCSVCGDRILASEFGKGQAVTVLKKNYCRKCGESVIHANATPSSSGERGKTSSPRKLQIRPPARDFVPTAEGAPLFTPMIVALLIGIVAFILLVVTLLRGSH